MRSRPPIRRAIGVPWLLPRLLASLVALATLGCGSSDPLAEARELHAEGRYEESIEPLRERLAVSDEDPELHYLYGVALSRTGQPSLALWPLRRAMESDEWLVPAGLELAAGALQTANSSMAIEAADRVLEAEPEHVGALIQRAVAKTYSRRDYEGALADAERALELDPEEGEAMIPRAVALLALERVDEAAAAIEALEEHVREESLDPEGAARYCTARASFIKEKGDLAAAAEIYRECLEEYPGNAVLLGDAIEFFDAQRDFERTIQILRDALEARPLVRPYRTALVKRLDTMGRTDEAEEILREATRSELPLQAAGAWADLGGFYIERDRFEAGIEAFERALEGVADPGPQLFFMYADALIVGGEYERALAVARDLTVPAYVELVHGRVHLERGEPEEALIRFAEGLRLWPDNAVARYLAALAAEQVGDIDRAIEEYRFSIRSDPEVTDARLRLARLHVAEGADTLALAVLNHGVADLPLALEELQLQARRSGSVRALPPRLERVVAQPTAWGRAVAALAAGLRASGGPEASAAFIQSADRLDLTEPVHAAALRALVVDLAATGKADEGLALARASAAAAPDAAPFQAILGLALRHGGAPVDDVRGAYTRALELDPESSPALAGLARIHAEAGEHEPALSLYERAAAADESDPAPAHAAVGELLALGRAGEAESRLERLLREHPYDAHAALRLGELRLARGAEAAALARRAERFGGGSEAASLLERAGAAANAADPGANAS